MFKLVEVVNTLLRVYDEQANTKLATSNTNTQTIIETLHTPNVEIRQSVVEIAPGGALEIGEPFPTSEYRQVYAVVRGDGGDFAVALVRTGFDATIGTAERGNLNYTQSKLNVAATGTQNVDSPEMLVRVFNNHTHPHRYSVYVGGIR